MKPIKLLLLLPALLLSACMSLPSSPVHLRIDAAKQLNPDTSLMSLPVRIKIFQLNDITLFKEATFRQLWKSDAPALGSTLLDKKELTINPGESQKIKMSRHPQAEYIAVVGIFRRHEDNGWKTIKRLPAAINPFAKTLIVLVKGHGLELQ